MQSTCVVSQYIHRNHTQKTSKTFQSEFEFHQGRDYAWPVGDR